jgi:hypothetical protein
VKHKLDQIRELSSEELTSRRRSVISTQLKIFGERRRNWLGSRLFYEDVLSASKNKRI